jgi:dTMP kinase
MVIWFEGVDTCGKTTQIQKLALTCKDIITTKEPGGTELGSSIRELILHQKTPISATSEMFLFLADRAEHYEKIIKENPDKLILSDRGFISGIAYALANSKELDLGTLLWLNRLAMGGKFEGKIVFFKTTKELIHARMSQKNHDNIESRGIDYLLKVQDLMEKIVARLELPVLQVDASNSKEEIQRVIKGFIDD